MLAISLAFVVAAAAYGAGEDFDFVILGDRTGGHVAGVYGEIVDEVNLLRPDVVVTVGDQWRANFRRKEQAKSSSADWQYPIGFDPRRFGYLAFE